MPDDRDERRIHAAELAGSHSVETVVVTAQRPTLDVLPSKILDTPQTIDVIPAEVIKAQGVNNLQDALKNLAGADTSRSATSRYLARAWPTVASRLGKWSPSPHAFAVIR